MLRVKKQKLLHILTYSGLARSITVPSFVSSIPASRPQETIAKSAGVKFRFPVLPKEWEGRYVKGQMYKYRDSLPKLPVPSLESTLKKYIDGVKPLLTEEEFARTCKIVERFGEPGGVGEQLQKSLLEYAEKEDNWLCKEFSMNSYLKNRKGYIYDNAGGISLCDPCKDQDSYVRRVAAGILGSLKMQMLTQNEAHVPEVHHNTVLCMEQYDFLSKCRIPSKTMDHMRITPSTESRHIIIIRNGHFYKLDVMYECPDATLTPIPPDHLMKELLGILQTAPETCEHPVGALTSGRRDDWHNTREKLLLDPINRSSLEVIETAMFICSLDKSVSYMDDFKESNFKYLDKRKTLFHHNLLHGCGSKQNGYNRWYDSSGQTMVGKDGMVGGMTDHVSTDGTFFVFLSSFIRALAFKTYENFDILAESSPVSESVLNSFQPLEWNISSEVANDIKLAINNMDRLSADVDIYTATFTEFGSNFTKNLKIPFDGFFQMALLLSYYKLHKKIAPIHEPATLRGFRHGRLIPIHTVTNEAYKFVKVMQDSTASSAEKIGALSEALKVHVRNISEAHQGQSFQTHFFGLLMMAQKNMSEIPEIFKDDAYIKTCSQWLILSGQIASKDFYPTFAPEGFNGYGICHNVRTDHVTISITSYQSYQETNSLALLEGVTKSMSELKALLSKF